MSAVIIFSTKISDFSNFLKYHHLFYSTLRHISTRKKWKTSLSLWINHLVWSFLLRTTQWYDSTSPAVYGKRYNRDHSGVFNFARNKRETGARFWGKARHIQSYPLNTFEKRVSQQRWNDKGVLSHFRARSARLGGCTRMKSRRYGAQLLFFSPPSHAMISGHLANEPAGSESSSPFVELSLSLPLDAFDASS